MESLSQQRLLSYGPEATRPALLSCLSLTHRADGVSQLSPTVLALVLVSWKKNFSMDQIGGGDGFRMIQVHYIYCAPKAASDLTGGGAQAAVNTDDASLTFPPFTSPLFTHLPLTSCWLASEPPV